MHTIVVSFLFWGGGVFILDLTRTISNKPNCSIKLLNFHIFGVIFLDLASFMMQCSDLSAPKAAKGFVKPAMNEVQPKRGKTITYQPSQKARAWVGDTGELKVAEMVLAKN